MMKIRSGIGPLSSRSFQREQVHLIVLTRAELEAPSHTEGLIRLLQDKVSCSQCRHAPSKADDLGHFPSVSTWPVSEMNWLTSPQSSRTGASLSSTARHQIGSRRVVAPGVSESADSRDHGHDD